MRILFCNYEYPPLGGGGGVVNALLAQEMAKRHEVTVLTSQSMDLPPERIEEGVRVVRVPVFCRTQMAAANLVSMFAYLPMGVRGGNRLLSEANFDVINTHFVLPSGPVGNALARRHRIPNILSLHGGDLYDPSKFTSPHRHPLLRGWIKNLLRKADIVVGQSRNTLDNMNRFYTPEIQGVRIPLGIQPPKMEVASRKDYGFKEDDVLLVTVGRLVSRKAMQQLLGLIESLGIENAHLLIIGTGPEEPRLRDESIKRNLGAQVSFLGQIEESEKFRILQMCDIYVSTSQHEGFGLVFLEAMACGLPIVCYNHGGQTDFLEDKKTGRLVHLNSIADFEECSRELILDRELRRRIGKENRNRVEDYFIDRCAERYEEVFQEAIAARR